MGRQHNVQSMLDRLARRKVLCVVLMGLAPLLIRAILLGLLPIPQPHVHDEFSHLLVADTFAHGRLVNPAHAMWIHFESMHIIMQPVYSSVFPIAQGAVMAAAQAVTGVPWAGVWLSVGGMCAAICWMLQGWVSPRWALLGSVLIAARVGVLSYWMNSYWGGAVAAIGGALVLGALPRLLRRARARDGAWFAIGLVILANSRPYEGLIFSLPFVLALALAAIRGRLPRLRVVAPLGLILGVAAVGMLYYFLRVTGNPLKLPYEFYRESRTQAPHFIWQSPRPEHVYYHRVTKNFYAYSEMAAYNAARANRSPYGVWDKAKTYFRFFIGGFIAVAFVTLPWMWGNRRTRLLLLVALLVAASLAVEVWDSPHYAAPATGLAVLLSIQALRQLHLWKYGRWLVALIVLGAVVTPVRAPKASGAERARILDQLRSIPGNHLAIVRYKLGHDTGDEWVYNHADIDGARVVWAREMDPTSNRALLRYFHDRRAWLVEPDQSPARISEYDAGIPPDPPFEFVKLGTRAIEVLRSPDRIKREVLARVAEANKGTTRLSCDQWNYFFTAVTAVAAPEVKGCFQRERGELVSADEWFAWLLRQP